MLLRLLGEIKVSRDRFRCVFVVFLYVTKCSRNRSPSRLSKFRNADRLSISYETSYGFNYRLTHSASELSWFTCMHEFINNEREISILDEVVECGIENLVEFIVSERVQINPDNSLAMRAVTFLLFKLNTRLQTKIVRKLWVSRNHGVMTVVCWIYTTAITPR